MNELQIPTAQLLELQGCKLTSTGALFKADMDYDQWESVGSTIHFLEKSVQFWIGDWHNFGERKFGEKYSQSIDGHDKQNLMDISWVCRQIQISRRREKLSFSHHREVAPMNKDLQDFWLVKAEEERLNVHDLRRAIQSQNHAKILENPTAIPNGKFSCIVIDPPWPMEKIAREVRPKQHGFDYPTMEIEDLKSFSLPLDKAADDCHLFLWSTHKFLPDAFALLDSWKFNYICCLVWHKSGGFQPFGLPQYNCEFVLYARKGSPSFLDTKAFPTCFEGKRGEHSEKPEEFYELLRRVTQEPRIDIFNRRKIEGFQGWGKESNE